MFEELDEAWAEEPTLRARYQARHRFDEHPCDDTCETAKPRWKLHPAVMGVLIAVLVALSGFGIWHTLQGGQTGTTGSAAEGAEAGSADAGDSDHSGTQSQAPSQAASATPIYVYVTGEVANPGLYELAEGDRVADAIDQAGGLTADADQTSVNLARLAQDGEHLHVYAQGETAAGMAASGSTSSGTSTTASGCINLNQASASELEALDGIGPTLASRIVAFREENGPFQTVEEVDAVSGIGSSLVQRIAVDACV